MAPSLYTIKVLLKRPIKASVESGEHYGFLIGYYRNIGICAPDQTEAQSILTAFVDDGTIVWEDSCIHGFEKIDKSIADKFLKHPRQKVWYASGRTFFPESGQKN
jgi:hypothetical protein